MCCCISVLYFKFSRFFSAPLICWLQLVNNEIPYVKKKWFFLIRWGQPDEMKSSKMLFLCFTVDTFFWRIIQPSFDSRSRPSFSNSLKHKLQLEKLNSTFVCKKNMNLSFFFVSFILSHYVFWLECDINNWLFLLFFCLDPLPSPFLTLASLL